MTNLKVNFENQIQECNKSLMNLSKTTKKNIYHVLTNGNNLLEKSV